MEKRRLAVCLVLAALAAAGGAAACVPPVEGARLESERFVLAYRAAPSVGSFFAVEVGACAKPGHPQPESLKVDAHMPEHRHGMNYAPTLETLAPGRWRAQGLLLHMTGKWELVFELRASGITDRVAASYQLALFTPEERTKVLQHGPWPPPRRDDPSNRVSGRRDAIALGEKLFFEPRLSGSGSVLCATCHAPFRAFQDARPRAFGVASVERNTPSLLDVRFYRWYGWDGAHDSLWAQSLRPLLDPREMNASAAHVAKVVRQIFVSDYRKSFDRDPPTDDEEVLVDVGKALAAFQETLVSAPTPFDAFRDALERNDPAAMNAYPSAAQRGLRLFVGKGNCALCHAGPRFTNSEFADTGIRFFSAPGRVDAGRFDGIRKLKLSAHNLLGRFNDDTARSTATGTRHVQAQHRNFGEWRVPGLRGVAQSAPYMHNGSLATLRDVVRHYSELDEERLHADGESILRPLKLSEPEVDDLVAFLESLSVAQ